MVISDDLIYRKVINLRDGARVLLRPLTTDDRQAFLDLYSSLSAEDIRLFRHNVASPEVVNRWVDELNYDIVLPIVAAVGKQIVGNATLHFRQGPGRHRAEVRIFLAKDSRRRGLGSKLLLALIELAKRQNIYLLEAQIVNDQTKVIKAFKMQGFTLKCVLDDYFMTPDGELKDVALLFIQIREADDEF